MKVCKWAGDVSDSFCKNCDGITMEVGGVEKSCIECAGYEEGKDTVPDTQSSNDVIEQAETPQNEIFNEQTENTAPKEEKPLKTKNTEPETQAKKKDEDIVKVSEVKSQIETSDGIRVTSIRYTSGATIKRGDNYFKFIAEEEWALDENVNVSDAREKMWAKLNSEVDKQIEELNSL